MSVSEYRRYSILMEMSLVEMQCITIRYPHPRPLNTRPTSEYLRLDWEGVLLAII